MRWNPVTALVPYRPPPAVRRRIGAGMTAGGSGLLGLGGWVVFRLYLRSKVRAQLREDGYDTFYYQSLGATGLVGFDLNLPPPEALVVSLVPMWSGVMPKTAVRDMLTNGRQSRYWPEKYRAGSALASLGVESGIFSYLLAKETREATA